MRPSSSLGFSLVELLVVIAVGAILSVLSLAAYNQIVNSSTLTSAAQSVTGLLDQARQTAITRNAEVEVRLYELPNYNDNPNTGALAVYRALQTFLVTTTGSTALNKVTLLPAPIVVFANPSYSSLLNSSSTTGDPSLAAQPSSAFNFSLPVFGTNYQAVAFRFTPNGGLSLSTSNQWYLTLLSPHDPIVANNLPANYATIQIDPFSGKTRTLRP